MTHYIAAWLLAAKGALWYGLFAHCAPDPTAGGLCTGALLKAHHKPRGGHRQGDLSLPMPCAVSACAFSSIPWRGRALVKDPLSDKLLSYNGPARS